MVLADFQACIKGCVQIAMRSIVKAIIRLKATPSRGEASTTTKPLRLTLPESEIISKQNSNTVSSGDGNKTPKELKGNPKVVKKSKAEETVDSKETAKEMAEESKEKDAKEIKVCFN